MNIKQQLRRLNAFGFFACLRITDAVWVVFLIGRGFSLWQVGLAEGVFHAVSLLCEIPSGMAADLIGRRRCLALSGLCGLVSALLMVLCRGFSGVCASMVFSALSCSFISGSDEALLYDSLLETGREQSFLAASAHYSRLQQAGTMLSNAASLLARVMGFIGFYCLDAGICSLRILAAWSLSEPAVTAAQALRQQHPLRDLGSRFRQHIRTVSEFLRKHPRAAALMLADGIINLPGYLTLMFLQQRLHELGVAAMWLGIPVMCIGLARMAGTAIGEKLRPKGLRCLYAGSAILVGAGTICAGIAPLFPAVAGAMLAAGAMDAWILHLQKHLNELFPSDQRATLVSVDMMAYSVLMVAAAPVTGWLGDSTGMSGAGLLMMGTVIELTGILILTLQARR